MLVKIEKDEKGKCFSQSRKWVGKARKSEKRNVFGKAGNRLAKPEKVEKKKCFSQSRNYILQS